MTDTRPPIEQNADSRALDGAGATVEPVVVARIRPPIGTATTRMVRVPICRLCGCVIDSGLCSYGCPNDTGSRSRDSILTAVYQRTDVLVSEE